MGSSPKKVGSVAKFVVVDSVAFIPIAGAVADVVVLAVLAGTVAGDVSDGPISDKLE